MNFYTTLSHYYDHIFGLKKQAVDFIKKELPLDSGKTLIDVAAGTGAEAIQLAEDGYEVAACDLNESMVQIMKEKTKDLSLPIQIHQLDMRYISQLPNKQYDGIYCIGNSFVHLDSKEEMAQVLEHFYDKLKHGGKVILQIVNFDRIVNEGMVLPLIKKENPNLTFRRFYTELGEKVTFHMKLEIEDGGEERTLTSETELFPLLNIDLEMLLTKSPFDSFTIYGDFKGNIYNPLSQAQVAVLEKDK